MSETSPKINQYFERISNEVQAAYMVATRARSKGYDPETIVEIPIARDMAERVEGLISVVCPQIVNSGVSKRIKELEKQYGILDWRVSLIIAEEIAHQKFCKFKDKTEAMEIGIRVGFAYHTLGTVSSPIEGFTKIEFKKRRDGKEYMAAYYSGPIRSAGGTGASISVLIADYVRMKMGYDVYDPSPLEIKRFSTELYDYHERINNLQYLPAVEEIEFMTSKLPIQISGDPSEKLDVSNYKDLDRVETNTIRNGVCLTIGEGLCQKAPKLWKQISLWGESFGLHQWKFLGEFVELQKKMKAGKKAPSDNKEAESQIKSRIKPDYTFIKDLVAGRPVLTHPLSSGGFRLRYGRARTSGYSSACINPLTMHILNRYIATGTQLKLERPGKGATVSPCDSIEGPILKLKDGSVIKPNQIDKNIVSEIEEILYLGDILINYGDFLNRAHPLIPPGYCEEWWVQEAEKQLVELFGSIDFTKVENITEIPAAEIEKVFGNPFYSFPSIDHAIILSQKLKIPLHPRYTYHWSQLSKKQFLNLVTWFTLSDIIIDNDKAKKIILPMNVEAKRALELTGIPHTTSLNEFVIIENEEAHLIGTLFKLKSIENAVSFKQFVEQNETDPLAIINSWSNITVRDKSGIFIGARMGRPEKAKMRKLTGSPHVLFPVGDQGGRLRSFQSALEEGYIESDFPMYYCKNCATETIFNICERCSGKTIQRYFCKICGPISDKVCTKHGETLTYTSREIDIKHYFEKALEQLGMKTPPDLIKGVRGTSNKEHIPENLAKGILRAKHEVHVDKDGTSRYDMTQMPITHFKPNEIGTSIEKLKELGYLLDIKGKPLENEKQILELFPQDVILPACPETPDEPADDALKRMTRYIDDLLVSLYGEQPYYNINKSEDLAGHLVIALAPHTSAGIIARIIGFSKTQVFFAHPMLHAATRRDCDGDEASVNLLLDSLLNFSRKYLPAHRGSTQDACLVITTRINPAEVDDMIFDLDCASNYPLEFYQACSEYKNAWEVKIDLFKKRLGTEAQYEGIHYTHPTLSINSGVRCSAYKTLPSMEEKLKGQMDLAEKIRAVNQADVAALVIDKHFLKDTKGNLRKFSQQQFRCVDCNEKFRRPPLIGRCTACKGKLLFTISEGSIVKYLEPSISLAAKYNAPDYLKQHLEILKRRVEDMFGKEKDKQLGLGSWF